MAFQHDRPPLEREADRADALERLDNGDRLALAMEGHVLAIAERPEPQDLDPETAQGVGLDLLELREGALKTAARIPLDGERELHLKLNALVNYIDDIGALLAERHSE